MQHELASKETAPSTEESNPLDTSFTASELIIGLVGAVGTDLAMVEGKLKERLEAAGYQVQTVHISRDIIPQLVAVEVEGMSEYERIRTLMDAGNKAREESGDLSILAVGAASWIATERLEETGDRPAHLPRRAYIINSLKHPAEALRLRQIYSQGFYLLGVHCEKERRASYLAERKLIPAGKTQELMGRDENERLPHGQHVSDTFHLSDFYVRLDDSHDRLEASLWRILDILFGDPYKSPTFDEFAMFLAFVASLRSADLSRQVGAVVANNNELLATGANDCPRTGGGLYWPVPDKNSGKVVDEPMGRDYMREVDSNKQEKQLIIEEILNDAEERGIDKEVLRPVLKRSRIRDLTEFGRVVHAEMEALLSCARNHVSTRGATIYCTTYPCHNCAKHIIAAGIERVVYVEPYEKSKASEFHDESLKFGFSGGTGNEDERVSFEPFVGIGPRRFFDLFSMRLGSGSPLRRKDEDGRVLEWKLENAHLRLQMLPSTYLDIEVLAIEHFSKAKESLGDE